MTTKRQIVEEIFKLTESQENQKKLKGNYYWMKFLGLNLDYTQKKYSMVVDINKFSMYEYIFALNDIKRVLEK